MLWVIVMIFNLLNERDLNNFTKVYLKNADVTIKDGVID